MTGPHLYVESAAETPGQNDSAFRYHSGFPASIPADWGAEVVQTGRAVNRLS
jgi:hypothetical protein